MRIYIGFDDTDTKESGFGTGKLTRWFEDRLPEGCTLWGVVRQQLLIDERIPYTSHNSSACMIVDAPDGLSMDRIITNAAAHIEERSASGSDPGLCVCRDGSMDMTDIIAFSLRCTRKVVSQKEALQAAVGIHLSAHGGTGDGIIGAAAGVGLTAYGRCGRFIEYGRLRDLPDPVEVSVLERQGIIVVAVDRQSPLPAPGDLVHTAGWMRPRLWAGQPLLPVHTSTQGEWVCVGRKKQKEA